MYVILFVYVRTASMGINHIITKGGRLRKGGGRKMSGISRYEKAALALTAAFLLFTAGWFLAGQGSAAPYEVTTARSAQEQGPLPRPEEDGGQDRPASLLEGRSSI